MHIVLAVLGSIITILVLLNRLDSARINLSALNPFLWYRRFQWSKRYHGDPAYAITNPMDAIGLLVVAIVKVDGDVSLEEKTHVLSAFESEFHLSKNEASALFSASSYILKDGANVGDNVAKVLAPSLPRFSEAQAASAMTMLVAAGRCGGGVSTLQRKIIDGAKEVFDGKFEPQKEWG